MEKQEKAGLLDGLGVMPAPSRQTPTFQAQVRQDHVLTRPHLRMWSCVGMIICTSGLTRTLHACCTIMQISAAVFYGVSSLLIMFINKSVLTTYRFPSTCFLAASQFAFTSIILFALKKAGKVRRVDYYPNGSELWH